MSGIEIDALYGVFCSRLPASERAMARELPFHLALAPAPDVPWSRVFKHEVTLGAPALLAEGMHGVAVDALENATIAHMLSVIEAFGTDRIADAQVEGGPELRRLLELMRDARDVALARVAGDALREVAHEADGCTSASISQERDVLERGRAVDLATYERISAGKQAVGLPASIGLAMHARCSPAQIETLRRALMGVWLGLQFQDDVVDWEDDASRGGAWVVQLAVGVRGEPPPSDGASLRRWIDGSAVPAELLARAGTKFEEARDGAASLGAVRLSQWAARRAAEAREQQEAERRSPGYMRRLRALSAFKAEVVG